MTDRYRPVAGVGVMRQEDLNEMMRLPWERKVTVTAWCKCPKCGENYCVDGVLQCTECQRAQQHHSMDGREAFETGERLPS